MSKEKDVSVSWSKLLDVRPEWIWLIVLALILIPMIFPLRVDFKVNESTQRIYEYIDALPEGSVIVSGGAGNYAFLYETSAAFMAFLTHIKARNMKLIILPLHPDSLMFEPWALDISGFSEVNEYGEDWVLLNYIPGGSYIVLPGFMEDIKGFCRVDLYGTPLDEIPVLDGIDNWEDIDLWVDCGANSMWSLCRYVAPYGTPIIGFVHSAYYPMFQPFKAAGLVYDFTNGIRGGAEYEKLVGYTPWNLGTITMDSYQLYSIFTLVLVVIGNIGLRLLKREGE